MAMCYNSGYKYNPQVLPIEERIERALEAHREWLEATKHNMYRLY
jgi:23S rRNA G2069 N7-methylase RlmK/C1962 C5-methylase RlmI